MALKAHDQHDRNEILLDAVAKLRLQARRQGMAVDVRHQQRRAVARLLGRAKPPTITRRAIYLIGRSTHFSIAKARDQLGWRPRVSIEEVRRQLKGGVERFDDPFEPMIPGEDWEMLK